LVAVPVNLPITPGFLTPESALPHCKVRKHHGYVPEQQQRQQAGGLIKSHGI
jgi:hypothetical protein